MSGISSYSDAGTPATGTNNVLTVCQVERGGGIKRGSFGEEIRTKKKCKTALQMETREEGRT